MANDPDPERLRALEARLKKVTPKPRPSKAESGNGFSQGEVAWRMVIELVSGMLLGLSIGYGLDYVFGTIPIFLIIFSLLGFAGGVRTMLGTARELAVKETAGQPAGEKDKTDGG
jgi:ATP synthase protein I